MAESRRGQGSGGGRTALAIVLILFGIFLATAIAAGAIMVYRMHVHRLEMAKGPPPPPAAPASIPSFLYQTEEPLEVGVRYRADRALRLLHSGNPAELTPNELRDVQRIPGRFLTTVPTGVFRVDRNERSAHDGTWWMLVQVTADSVEEDLGQRAVERWLDSTQLLGATLYVVERPGDARRRR